MQIASQQNLPSRSMGSYTSFLEEQILFKLWDDTLNTFNLRTEEIRSSIWSIRHSLNVMSWRSNENFEGINFDNLSNCCGYLQRYAGYHCIMVRQNIIEVLAMVPESVLTRFLGIDELKVVSIGGGPGNDMMGFCSALYEEYRRQFRSMKLTVVDMKSGWLNLFSTMVNLLRTKKYLYGNCGKFFAEMNVKTEFLHADVKVDKPECLRSADVVLMVKVLSIVSETQKKLIVKNIFESMKEGSVSIFIDSHLDAATHYILRTPSSGMKVHYHTPQRIFTSRHVRSDCITQSTYKILVCQKQSNNNYYY